MSYIFGSLVVFVFVYVGILSVLSNWFSFKKSYIYIYVYICLFCYDNHFPLIPLSVYSYINSRSLSLCLSYSTPPPYLSTDAEQKI